MKKALIIQGGGFRTAFSSGVLDAFIEHQHNPFQLYVAVSGGAIAASYFISQQKRHCFEAICFLSEKNRFVKYTNVLKAQPVMDVDIFHDISNIHFPFDMEKALKELENKQFSIVMTNMLTAEAYYCQPKPDNWREAVIASCSLPFVTKGKHSLNGTDYMDGAWSDPLPVEWTVQQGAMDITIVRTTPANLKSSKSWIDYIGEIYYSKDEKIRQAFSKNHEKYNRSIDYINQIPRGIRIHQIAPEQPLKAGSYTNSIALLEEDYKMGYQKGLDFLSQYEKFKPI